MEESSNPDRIWERRGEETNQPTLGFYLREKKSRIPNPMELKRPSPRTGRSSGPPRRRRFCPHHRASPSTPSSPRALQGDRGSTASIRRVRHRLRARHREADPLGRGRPQGQHARLLEQGDDRRRRRPEVSAKTRETLFCIYCEIQVRFL